MKMDLDKILHDAEQLFYNYVRKKVTSPPNDYVMLSELNEDDSRTTSDH